MADTAARMDRSRKENLPPSLEALSEQPHLFDGTTRLYTCYTCPYAQRVWIARNFKGLQDKIKLVPLNLKNRPAWYAKIYPTNKVPSLEHNGKVIGESLDLIKYIDSNFEGPLLSPTDDEKQKYADNLLDWIDEFHRSVSGWFGKEDIAKEAGPAFDQLESFLGKFDDSPFFLGQFSLVDIAYIPFIERLHIFLSEEFKYDITDGRPNLKAWITGMNKIEAYKMTKTDPQEIVKYLKNRYMVSHS